MAHIWEGSIWREYEKNRGVYGFEINICTNDSPSVIGITALRACLAS